MSTLRLTTLTLQNMTRGGVGWGLARPHDARLDEPVTPCEHGRMLRVALRVGVGLVCAASCTSSHPPVSTRDGGPARDATSFDAFAAGADDGVPAQDGAGVVDGSPSSCGIPAVVGSVVIAGLPVRLASSDGHLYLTLSLRGMDVIDARDPTAMALVSESSYV